jgi:hypothetical protein
LTRGNGRITTKNLILPGIIKDKMNNLNKILKRAVRKINKSREKLTKKEIGVCLMALGLKRSSK